MLRRGKIAAVAAKEIRDILRDRRTLFLAVVFPLVLYPLLIVGLVQFTVARETMAGKKTFRLAVAGAENAPGLARRLAEAERLDVVKVKTQGEAPERTGAVVGVVVPEGFEEALAGGSTASVEVYYDSADQDSRDALDRVAGVINSYRSDVLEERLEAEGLESEFIKPVRIERKDLATPQQRGAFEFGKIVAFLLVVLCMMGALYPAIDAVCGEKERGTLETLLSIPATRFEILGGKYAAVLSMSLASVLANFVSLSLTMLALTRLLETAGAETALDLSVPPAALALFLPALVPLAAFFSAVCLGVAAFARSTREGQYYLGPLYAAVLPLAAVALSPAGELTWATAVVPVLSVALFLKAAMLGTLSAGPALLAVGLTCLYAWQALRWAGRVFSREEVLFAGPRAEGAVRGRAGAPISHVLFVWVVSLILFFFAGARLAYAFGPGRVWVSAVVNVAFVAAPPLVYAALWRLDWRRVFSLGRAGGWNAFSILLFTAAAVLLGMAAKAAARFLLGAPEGIVRPGRELEGGWELLISVALLPAICEELLYRGFIFRSLLSRVGAFWAVAVSALLFALAHQNPYELLPLFVLGVVLAAAARRSGGLLVPAAVHFLNNCVFVAAGLGRLEVPLLQRRFSGMTAVVLFAGLVVAGVLAALAGARLASRGGESD